MDLQGYITSFDPEIENQDERVINTLLVAENYAMEDGAHHKQWVIDQMLRILLGLAEYREWVDRYNAFSIANDYEVWDEGIAP